MQAQLEQVTLAIDMGDKAQARTLLAPILKNNPTAEAWELAARVVETDEQAAICLKKAVMLDPQNQTASRLLEYMDAGQAESILESKSEDELLAYLGLGQAVPVAADPPPKATKANNKDAGVYEMLWDCQNCGSTKLLGKTHRFCPHCGTPQDSSWRYFPSDEDKVAVEDHQFVGADRTCASCGTLNSAESDFCQRCGAPLDNAVQAKRLITRDKAMGQSFVAQDLTARLHEEADAAVGRGVKPQAARKPRLNRNRIIAIVAVVLAVIAGLVYFINRTEEKSVFVSDYRWERTISIEELRAVGGNSSCGSEPVGAYGIDRRYEQVDTRQVADGETCRNVQIDQGDGTFRQQQQCTTNYRSEPVYGYVCYYTVNTWVNARSAKADGTKDNPVVWPNTGITSSCNSLGCERESGRDENYYLVLQADGDKQYECKVPVDQWQNTPIESRFTLEINIVTDNPICNTLTAAG